MKSFFRENLMIALAELWAHKTRTILTGTGIVIGIIAVSLMSTLINGVDGLFENSMKFLGRDNLYIEKWPWLGGGEDWWTLRNRPRIDLDMADEIHERPTVIVARTTKGKGVSFMEGSAAWHGSPPNESQYREAIAELKGAAQ